jgi:O-methyltransferase
MNLQQITLGNKGVLEFTSDLCKKVSDIEGDFCEAGVAHGGQLVNMWQSHPTKKVYAFDSFQGIAHHGDNDHEFTSAHGKGENNPRKSMGVTSVSLADCKQTIMNFVPTLDRFVFVEGWFIDTLPKLTDENFSIIRLDCDIYESYKTCLEYLYPRLSVGGYLIIDDWSLSGCKKALFEYFGEISNSSCFMSDNLLGNCYIQKK